MPRPSSRTAAAQRPYAELAARLRGLRVAAHLTQQRLGQTPGLSRSAVQRCESGSTAPSPEVLRAYIDACRGTDADRRIAQTLRARGRAVHRGRLPLLRAPHPTAIRTRPDLHAALAAAYENAGAPRLRDFALRVPKGGAPISLATACRIVHRQALPSSVRQLETWLSVCGVPAGHRQHYRGAFSAVTAHRPVRCVPSRVDHHRRLPELAGVRALWETVAREAARNGVHPKSRYWLKVAAEILDDPIFDEEAAVSVVANDVAVADMIRLGNAEPLVPYPGGARKPWRCRCLSCGKIIYPNRNNVMSAQGACKYCAPNAPVDPRAAAAKMLDHGFQTLVPYPGTGKPWLSQCTAAGHLVAPRYDNTPRRGGACGLCTRHGPGDPQQALADMKAAGFTPLEPFRNVSSAWTSLCGGCGKIVSPKLNNVRTRGACCAHCAKYGLDPAAPAWLYVMAHAGLGAVKIGITGRHTREDRVARLEGSGWTEVRKWPFDTGDAARHTEQTVLKLLRSQGHAPFLAAAQMPAGGWTETFDGTVVTAAMLCLLIIAAHTDPPV